MGGEHTGRERLPKQIHQIDHGGNGYICDVMMRWNAHFNIDDFMAHLGEIAELGPTGKVIGMIPGMSDMTRQLGGDGVVVKQIVIIRAICGSMTPLERAEPDRIGQGQRRRIARGAGVSQLEVNQLMRQFEITRTMMNRCFAMSFPPADRILSLGAVTDRVLERDPSFVPPAISVAAMVDRHCSDFRSDGCGVGMRPVAEALGFRGPDST